MAIRCVFFAPLRLRGEKFPLIFSLTSFDTNHYIKKQPCEHFHRDCVNVTTYVDSEKMRNHLCNNL